MKKYPVGQWNREGQVTGLGGVITDAGVQRHVLDTVEHPFNPSSGQRQADLCEFKDNLVYIVSTSASTYIH